MGNASSSGSAGVSLRQEAALAVRRFTPHEVRVLKETFKDLAQRSPGKTVDKATFLHFFPLPGLLGERLFMMFDRKNTGVIDYDEFMCGLAISCRGSWEEKVQFVFNIYDLAGDGSVSRAELTTMLNHVPRAALVMSDDQQSQSLSSSHDSRGPQARGASLGGPGHDTHSARGIVQQFTNGEMVELAFAECDLNHDGRLSFPQFKMWCERTPQVLAFLQSVLPQARAPDAGAGTGVGTGVRAGPGPGTSHGTGIKSTSVLSAGSPSSGPVATAAPSVRRSNVSVAPISMKRSSSYNSLSRMAMGEVSRDVAAGAQSPRSPMTPGSPASAVLLGADASNSMLVRPPSLTLPGAAEGGVSRAGIVRSLSAISSGSGGGHSSGNGHGSGSGSSAGGVAERIEGGVAASSDISSGVNEHDVDPLVGALRLALAHARGRPELEEGIAQLLDKALSSAGREGQAAGAQEATGAGAIGTAVGTASTAHGPLEGSLWKVGSRFGGWRHRWYRIENGFLYHFASRRDAVPRGVTFLGGCVVQPVLRGDSDYDAAHEAHQFFGLRVCVPRQEGTEGSGISTGSRSRSRSHSRSRSGSDSGPGLRVSVKDAGHENTGAKMGETGATVGTESATGTATTASESVKLLYAKSEAERDVWVARAQAESDVVAFDSCYEVDDTHEVGRGRFSTVYACRRRQPADSMQHGTAGKSDARASDLAVKVIHKDRLDGRARELMRGEIAVLRLVRHPNILELVDFFEDATHIRIVTPLKRGGELYARIAGRPRFSERDARAVLQPLAESVFYLHQLGIVHRDLKPENILCGDTLGDITVSDFGLSKLVAPQEELNDACGTLAYVAPEVLDTSRGYGKSVDMWSVGVILFLMLRGQLPYEGETRQQMLGQQLQQAVSEKLNDEVWSALSHEARDLVAGLLHCEPEQRLSAQNVLEHPWMKLVS